MQERKSDPVCNQPQMVKLTQGTESNQRQSNDKKRRENIALSMDSNLSQRKQHQIGAGTGDSFNKHSSKDSGMNQPIVVQPPRGMSD